jgi:hypothetical protein
MTATNKMPSMPRRTFDLLAMITQDRLIAAGYYTLLRFSR